MKAKQRNQYAQLDTMKIVESRLQPKPYWAQGKQIVCIVKDDRQAWGCSLQSRGPGQEGSGMQASQPTHPMGPGTILKYVCQGVQGI